ncbi:MAG: SRPBCC domain-containing protein [Nitrososphaeraceae archaeon]
MKSIEIENENVQRHLSTNENGNEKTLNSESKVEVTIEGEYGTLKFERRLSHPREIVWKAITDPKEIFRWLPDYKGTIDGHNGGTIDLVNTVSGRNWRYSSLGSSPHFLSMSGISLLIRCSPMENLNLLSGGSSSRTAIQIHSSLL